MLVLTEELLIEEYVVKEKSTYVIAKEYNTYPNKILRLLHKYKIPIRDKSTAQVVALNSGRHPHPTEGSKHSEETKNKIREKNRKYI